MQYRSRTAYPEPSTPLTVFDRHAAAAFQSLLDDQPLLEPLREAVYGPWMRPLHAVAVAYATGGQAAAAARFAQLARRSRGLRVLLTRRAAEPAIKHKLADLLAAPVPSEREVVPGLVPRGLTILAGKPHAGKSWLSLELALAVASGSQVCDLKEKVLYLAFEDPPWRLQRRLHQLTASPNLPLQFACGWPLLDGGGLIQLAAEMASGQRLVIVDTLTAALSTACLASPARILAVLARLHVLAAACDAAVLLVDRHRAPESWPPGLSPSAVDLAFAAADGAGLFAKTITLARPHGGKRATLQLSDYPYPIVLARHPDLKHETLGTSEGTTA
ncbi:MAG: AAA family ATPase [Caldilineaceae bacterium]